MKHEYRTFKLTLRTMAPLHIGSGEKYTSREFIYENGAYYFPDMGKFYSSMVEKGLSDKFESFLMEHGKASRNNRLISFVEGNRIRERNFGGYKIQETGFEKDKSTKGTINEVSKYIRDGFGKPYIPGSSLKGAIRTVLLNTHPQWEKKNFVLENKRENKRKTTIFTSMITPFSASSMVTSITLSVLLKYSLLVVGLVYSAI